MHKQNRTAWTRLMMLQAALLSAAPLFASDDETEKQVLSNPAVRSDDAEEGEARSNPEVRKTKVARPRPEKPEPIKVREVQATPGKNVGGGVISRSGRITVKSADGKTFEIVAPEGPIHILQDQLKELPPGKPVGAGRAFSIIRTADGVEKIIEPDDVEGLISGLTLHMRDKIAAEAPRFVIGVSVTEAPEAMMVQLGREDDPAVVVDSVLEDSPAAKAGVKKFDLILKAADEPVGSAQQLTKLVKLSEGNEIDLVLLRAGKELTVKLTPRPNEPVKAKVSDGMIHFGPALMERRMMGMPGEPGFGHGPLLEEIKALRKDMAELKKMVEELKAEK